jgi:hypothetical protein
MTKAKNSIRTREITRAGEQDGNVNADQDEVRGADEEEDTAWSEYRIIAQANTMA